MPAIGAAIVGGAAVISSIVASISNAVSTANILLDEIGNKKASDNVAKINRQLNSLRSKINEQQAVYQADIAKLNNLWTELYSTASSVDPRVSLKIRKEMDDIKTKIADKTFKSSALETSFAKATKESSVSNPGGMASAFDNGVQTQKAVNAIKNIEQSIGGIENVH